MQYKTWPVLYKLDNKGKIRIWYITAFPGGSCHTISGAFYLQEHGVLHGKLQQKYTEILSGKNIGKANETTEWEQCLARAESIWKKQRDRKGYSETIPTEKPFGPMLAQRYDQHGHKIKFPCSVQPKLDGLRCLASVDNKTVTLLSRQRKQFKAVKHIEEEIKSMMGSANLTLDGELYLHSASFQDIVGAIKRDEANALTSHIEYHVYDLVDENNKFEDRYLNLCRLFGINMPSKVKLVPTYTAYTEDDITEFHLKFLADGYEGSIVRNKHGLYQINGRSYDLQKVKNFDDEEFTIIHTLENEKSPGTPTFVCLTKDGVAFKVTPEGSQEHREALFRERSELAGKQLTVAFFGWTTPKKEDIGKPDPDYADLADDLMIDIVKGPRPRFPVGKAIRGDY